MTPPEIVSALGAFDLDPCSPVDRPWDTAGIHYTKKDDGLALPWSGRVWCNPPYGKEAARWLSRMNHHGNGIALVFARTDTEMFFKHVWDSAQAILFIKGRLTFYTPEGDRAKGSAGAPSVLIAYGENNATKLKNAGIEGKFITLT